MAVQINQYEGTTTPQGALLDADAKVSPVFGAMQDLGNSMARAAVTGLEIKKKMDQREAQEWTAENLSAYQSALIEHQIGAIANAPEDGKDLTGGVINYAGTLMDGILKDAPNEEARKQFRLRAGDFALNIKDRTLAKEFDLRQGATSRKLGAAVDNAAKSVAMSPDMFADVVAPVLFDIEQADLSGEQKSEMKQKAKQSLAYTAQSSMVRANPQEWLNRDKSKDLSYNLLSADDQIKLTDIATSRAQAANDKRESSAERLLGQYEMGIYKGIPMSAGAIREVRNAVSGTKYEQDFNNLLADENEIQKVLRQPRAEQVRYIAEQEADLLAGGADLKGRKVRMVESLRNAIAAEDKLATESPVAYVAKQSGELATRIDPVMLATDQNTMAAILADRVDQISGLEKSRGPVMARPLYDDEAAVIRDTLTRMTPQARAEKLGEMNRALGSRFFNGAVAQIFAGDNNAISAGVFAGRGLKTQDGGDVASMILRGDQIVKDKSVTLVGSGGAKFDDTFNTMVGSAVVAGSPERQALMDRTKAIYASLAEKQNSIGQPLDESLLRQAVNVATGGMTERGGRQVIKPYGMSDDDFDNRTGRALDRVAQLSGYPVDALEDLPLLPSGREGVYFIADGNRPIANAAGQPLTIDVTKAVPVIGTAGK